MNVEAGVYRIGQVLDANDQEQVRGLLLMGRSHDSFTADPNNLYFNANGVPANFATSSKPLLPIPAKPSYDVFPFKNKKGKIIKKTTKPRNAWIIFRASRHAPVKAANPGFATVHLCKSSFFEHQQITDDK